MPASLRVAIVGAGRMAQTHARALQKLRNLTVCAVCDPERDKAQSLAAQLGADIRSFEGALADPTLNAVLLTTPVATHAPLIVQAAEAGKHIFVEKPLATTLDGAARVVAAVRDAGVQCQVGFQRRFDPAYVEVKRAVDAGELGQLASFRGVSRDPAPPTLGFLKTSGGLMLDLGVHDLDTARFLVGEVAAVYAVGRVQGTPELAAFGLFDSAVATLEFDNGALGTLELGLNTAYGYEVRAEVLGEKGRLHLEMDTPLSLTRYTADEATKRAPQSFEERFFGGYVAELGAFAACVLGGRPVSPDAEDAARTLKLALAAQHALETQTRVTVQDFHQEASHQPSNHQTSSQKEVHP